MSDQPDTLRDALARIDALEERIAHQDRTIEELNQMVTDQWKELDRLTRQVTQMADRLQQVEDRPASESPDPPPPHY